MSKSNLTPLQIASTAAIRPMDLVACENVAMATKQESTKREERVLIVSVPPPSSRVSLRAGATLSVAKEESKGLKIRQTMKIERLESCTNEGGFNAVIDFGSQGMVQATFESHVQREMFVAALKRTKRDIDRGASSSNPYADGVQGFVSESMEAAVKADAESRAAKLRQQKRRAFTVEEETLLLNVVGRHRNLFHDMSRMERLVNGRMKELELESIKYITDAADVWQQVRKDVVEVQEEVHSMESRVRQYASSLLAKKSIIQQIEHSNNLLHRKQRNMETLCETLEELHGRLSLPPRTAGILEELRRESDNIVSFFADRGKAKLVSDAMRHMQGVLLDAHLEDDYPIQVVQERKRYFLDQRKMIVGKAKLYCLAVIEIYKVFYLQLGNNRLSGQGRVVLKLHAELLDKLEDIDGVIVSLGKIDMEGFASVLRKYRASMQHVYAIELKRFFTELKKQMHVTGWAGPSLLGNADTVETSMAQLMESGAMGETPDGSRRLSWDSPAAAASPGVLGRLGLSPAVTLRGGGVASSLSGGGGQRNYFTDPNDHASEADRESVGSKKLLKEKWLVVELPELDMNGLRLQRPGVLRDAKLKAASVASAVSSRLNAQGGGVLRPDIAFAMALEAVVDLVLREEQILQRCFGLVAEPVVEGGEGENGEPDNEEEEKDMSRHQRNAKREREELTTQVASSLTELFAGDNGVGFLMRPQDRPPLAPKAKPSARRRRSDDDDDDDEDETSSNEDESDAKKDVRLYHSYLEKEVVTLAKFIVERCDRLYCIPALCMIRAYLRDEMNSAKSRFIRPILLHLETVMSNGVAKFVAEQTDSIAECGRRWSLRPHALLHSFAKLPTLLRRLEAVHNSLNDGVVDYTNYSSAVMGFVDQNFDVLDVLSHLRPPTAREASTQNISLADFIVEQAKELIGATVDGSDPMAIKRGFLHQYRHHAFFYAAISSFPEDSYVRQLLHERVESSLKKRERYEELYLTRLIFVDHLPTFAHFILTAEDLTRTYSLEEVSHHRALSVTEVQKVLDALPSEVPKGVVEATKRIRKHFTRDVRPNSPEEGFHRSILQVTWQHFVLLVKSKLKFLETAMKTWPQLKEARLSMSFGSKDLQELAVSMEV